MMFTLQNGVIIKLSRLSKTGYEGSYHGPDYFKNHGNRIYGAHVDKPNHPLLVAVNKCPKRTNLELGSYADPREAAYVHSLWNLSTTAEQLEILVAVQNGMYNPTFPDDLYDLPVLVSYDTQDYSKLYKSKPKSTLRTVTSKKPNLKVVNG